MTRQIFRPSALKRYNERLEKVALPRYASLPWVVVLWVIFGLLVAFTAVLWAARTPVYASGPAVVVAAPAQLIGAAADDPQQPMAAAFLPAEYQGQLALYQRARLLFGALEGEATAATATGVMSMVAFVEPDVVAPAAVRARLALDASSGLLVEEPVVVALIPLEGGTAELLGSVGEVQIEIGTQPGLALLPGIGRFFDTNFTNNTNEALTELGLPAPSLVATSAIQPEAEPVEAAPAVMLTVTAVPSPSPEPTIEPTTSPELYRSFVPFVSEEGVASGE